MLALGSILVWLAPLLIAWRMTAALRARVALSETRIAALEGFENTRRPAAAAFQATPEATQPPDLVPLAAEAPPEPAPGPESGIAPSPTPAPVPPPTRPRRDLETVIGGRWTVWVGGLALALGGLFLVRYSIEQDLLGPEAKVGAGALFAALLLAAGEQLRRRMPAPEDQRAPPVSALVTAAGTISAYGAVYAAFALYGLIPPAAAFVLLAVVAVATMLAALLHGPALAALGLAGAYAVPALVSTASPEPLPLVLFFVALSVATYGVARVRQWRWLAMAGALGAVGWAAVLLLDGFSLFAIRLHVVLQTILAILFLVADPHRGAPDEAARPDRFATLMLAYFFGAATLALPGGAATPEAFAGLMLALGVATGVIFAPAAAALPLGAALAVATLAIWPSLLPVPVDAAIAPVRPAETPDLPENAAAYLAFAFTAAVSTSLLAGWRLLRGAALPRRTAALYAAGATLTPLAALLVAWWRMSAFSLSPSFALAAGLLAAAFAAEAVLFLRRLATTGSPTTGLALAAEAFAAAAVAALALGLTMILDKGGLTLALALSAAGAAWVSARGPLGSLRIAVGALGVAVVGRVLWDPSIVGGDVGSWPIFNWLLIGYGVPALCFFMAARWLRVRGQDWAQQLSEALAILFAALLAMFEVRHLATGGDLLASTADHLELGLHTTTALTFSAALMRIDALRPNRVYRAASLLFGALSLVVGLFGLGFDANPLFGGMVGGGPLVNTLLLGYAAPAIAALVLARVARSLRPRWFVRLAGGLGLLLAFLYVSLEVRRIWQGPDITLDRGFGGAETWTYSAVWLLVGLALLAVGFLRHSRLLRLVSAGFVALTVVKVFLLDMSGLEGVWRAASFIALGGVLMLIGLVYQRFLAPAAEAEPTSGAT